MIVRWGLEELQGILRELEIDRPYLVATERWDSPLGAIGIEHARWTRLPTDEIDRVVAWAGELDGVVALGGGSTIDTGKAVSARTGRPLVSIPTTYSGAEWTTFFGLRDAGRRRRGGGDGAHTAGIVYEPKLTLELSPAQSVGTAMNALAHCAEALYVRNRNDESDRHALAGAACISRDLPVVVENGSDLGARTRLLHGAAEAGAALAGSGLALGHAMAQALGGRYGLPHGTLNAICLPAALRFNQPVAESAIARFGEALGTERPVARVEELARLGGFVRLRELGVPLDELGDVAEAVAARPGMRLNPRPASPSEIAELLRSVW